MWVAIQGEALDIRNLVAPQHNADNGVVQGEKGRYLSGQDKRQQSETPYFYGIDRATCDKYIRTYCLYSFSNSGIEVAGRCEASLSHWISHDYSPRNSPKAICV